MLLFKNQIGESQFKKLNLKIGYLCILLALQVVERYGI